MNEPPRPAKLVASFRIGSCKAPIAYQSNEVVFHSADIPESKRKLKEEVKDFLNPNILELKQPQWNNSADTGEKLCIRQIRTLSVVRACGSVCVFAIYVLRCHIMCMCH